MSDYEENLYFSQKFCENYRNRNHEEIPELQFVKIMLNKYEKHSNFMVIFSFQTPNEMNISSKSTIVLLDKKKNEFRKEFKSAFLMYFQIGSNFVPKNEVQMIQDQTKRCE